MRIFALRKPHDQSCGFFFADDSEVALVAETTAISRVVQTQPEPRNPVTYGVQTCACFTEPKESGLTRTLFPVSVSKMQITLVVRSRAV